MSVLVANKPVNIFSSEISDKNRLEKLADLLESFSVQVNIHLNPEAAKNIIQAEQDNTPSILIFAYRNSDAALLEEIIATKDAKTNIIVLRLDSGEFNFSTESFFHIEAGFLPEDLLSDWLFKKITFLKSFKEVSDSIYSRALHWLENEKDDALLLESNELFDAIHWLEQSVESQKELRDLDLKKNYISVSRQKHYPFADAYMHCGNGFKGIGLPILQVLRETGFEIIAGNYISPKVYEYKFNENEIKRSNNFIFIYSPNSSQQEACKKALSYARSLNKRIITLVTPEMRLYNLPPEVDKSNVVHVPSDWMFNQDFIKNIEEKILLEKDYVQQHTQYIIKALDWIKHKKNYRFLIQDGEEISAVADWLTKAEMEKMIPKVSSFQKLYIEKSLAVHSLQRNIKLGALIIGVLIVLIGSLFLLFIKNSGDQVNESNDIPEVLKVSTFDAKQSAFNLKWQALKDKGAKPLDYFKTYYGKDRHVRIINNTDNQIEHVSTTKKNLRLLSYGISRFDMVSREGQLIRKFEVDDHEIFKAEFIPDDNNIIAVGSKGRISKWQQDGKLLKVLNPDINQLCRDFVFLSSQRKIAFLLGNNSILITDFDLNISKELKTNQSIEKLYNVEENTLGVLHAQSFKTYNADNDWTFTEEELPVKANKIVFTSQETYLLGNENKVYQRINKQWQLLDLPYSVSDLVEGKKGTVFLLNEENGIYLLSNQVKPQPVFATQSAKSYSKIFKSEASLVVTANNYFGGNSLIELPDSIPVSFNITFTLQEKPLKVFRGVNMLFSVETKSINGLKKVNGEKLWNYAIEDSVTAYAFNPDKKKLLIGDAKGNIFHINSKGELLKKEKWTKHTVKCIVIDIQNDINYLADSEGNIIAITDDGNEIFRNNKHLGAISFLALSSNAQYIISAGVDSQMIIWEKSGKQYNKLKGPTSVITHADFSGSNSFLLSLGKSGDYTLWDIEGNVIRYEKSPSSIHKAFFHASGEFIVLAGEENLQAINAKGNTIFDIVLPPQVTLKDIAENNNGELELLCHSSEKDTYFLGILPFSKNAMQQEFLASIQL